MPTPPTAAPRGVTIHQLTDSRWQAACGRCMRTSVSVPAVGADQAWAELQRIGWTYFVSQYGGQGYALCQRCSTTPVEGAKPKRPRRRR